MISAVHRPSHGKKVEKHVEIKHWQDMEGPFSSNYHYILKTNTRIQRAANSGVTVEQFGEQRYHSTLRPKAQPKKGKGAPPAQARL